MAECQMRVHDRILTMLTAYCLGTSNQMFDDFDAQLHTLGWYLVGLG